MKKILYLMLFFASFQVNAIIDFYGDPFVLPVDAQPSCLGIQYFEVGINTYYEINNDKIVIQRSLDINFNVVTTVATLNGCGTCGERTYSAIDYGPFQPGQVWFYRIKAVSNNLNYTYSNISFGIVNQPTVVNWNSQVTHEVLTGSSPDYEGAYTWNFESRNTQGVNISLMPTEKVALYLEQGNNKLNFNAQTITPFYSLELNINNTGYFSIHNGSGVTSKLWDNSATYFTDLGVYELKVRFMNMNGTFYYREYEVRVVPPSNKLYVDNYCNTMRLWKSPVSNGIPIVFSEGFDAYNTRTEQFYRYAGNELISCLLDKGFDIYVVNYSLNAQSIRNNGSVFQSAIRYVSSINNNRKVVPIGMSMGGVINRYACAKAENDGNPLPISKFVTLDAPHQGAVISPDFQDFRFETLGNGSDPFAAFNLSNQATKELLLYSAWNSDGTVHSNFYNELNNLNGDGYPHLVETIGVSFSNSDPNPNAGEWLLIDITGTPAVTNESFYLSDNEKLPGSYLPPLNIDDSPVFTSEFGDSWALSLFRPFSDPSFTVIQYSDPTFIPHNSSLDIVNGISKFDLQIIPQNTSFHDVVPSDIIEPLINAILSDYVYVQNVTYSEDKSIIARKKLFAGENVTNEMQFGVVNVMTPAKVEFEAGEEVVIMPGFYVEGGADFVAKIGTAHCDGVVQSQLKMDQVVDNVTEAERPDANEREIYNVHTIMAQAQDETTITVFPNPSTGSVSFKLNWLDDTTTKEYSYQILNLLGQTIDAGQVDQEIYTLYLESGTYIIHFAIDGKYFTEKLIVR